MIYGQMKSSSGDLESLDRLCSIGVYSSELLLIGPPLGEQPQLVESEITGTTSYEGKPGEKHQSIADHEVLSPADPDVHPQYHKE